MVIGNSHFSELWEKKLTTKHAYGYLITLANLYYSLSNSKSNQ
jgi:hypothetical protein